MQLSMVHMYTAYKYPYALVIHGAYVCTLHICRKYPYTLVIEPVAIVLPVQYKKSTVSCTVLYGRNCVQTMQKDRDVYKS